MNKRTLIATAVTVFAASTPGREGPVIWNDQLIRYAGHRTPAGDVRGDGKDVIRGGWGVYQDFGYLNSNVLFAAIDSGGLGHGLRCGVLGRCLLGGGRLNTGTTCEDRGVLLGLRLERAGKTATMFRTPSTVNFSLSCVS
mgnify:CR=1 FL=1